MHSLLSSFPAESRTTLSATGCGGTAVLNDPNDARFWYARFVINLHFDPHFRRGDQPLFLPGASLKRQEEKGGRRNAGEHRQ